MAADTAKKGAPDGSTGNLLLCHGQVMTFVTKSWPVMTVGHQHRLISDSEPRLRFFFKFIQINVWVPTKHIQNSQGSIHFPPYPTTSRSLTRVGHCETHIKGSQGAIHFPPEPTTSRSLFNWTLKELKRSEKKCKKQVGGKCHVFFLEKLRFFKKNVVQIHAEHDGGPCGRLWATPRGR